jgi:Flp pilus assembly protein CpaB
MANTKARPGDRGAAQNESTDVAPPRPVHRRRPAVGRRALIGGLLVAVAMVGTFATYSTGGDKPADRVLVLRRAVRAGEPLAADDVHEERASLPAAALDSVLSSPAALAGAVALAPLQEGDVLQRSAVLLSDQIESGQTDPGLATEREFSLPVERDRALNGEIAQGETVDVLATYGTGESAYTVAVARRARVVDVAETTGGLGSDGRIEVSLALEDADAVLRATHASVAAVVTLVRSTRALPDNGADRYSPGESAPKRL